MKRDFIESLGIEDKEVIDKIMAENGNDINKAKGELEAIKTQLADKEINCRVKRKNQEL